MSISLLRQTANALFDIRLRRDVETGEFNAHAYYVSTLAALERLGLVEHIGPDRWRLTELGVTTAISIPEHRAKRLGQPAPATDDVIDSDDARDRRGAH